MRENADRFEGLAESYEMHRPGYPHAPFADLVARSPAAPSIAVDVGAGPGNSTAALRQALPATWLVIAAEPGRDMRRVLSRRFAHRSDVQVMDATAEALPLPAGSASLIVAASAVHWFAREEFFSEAARVLAPGGTLALVRNRLQPTSLIEAFDSYVAERSVEVSDFGARERRKNPSLRDLALVDKFTGPKSRSYAWQTETDLRGLIDLYLTRSTLWSVVRRLGLKQVVADLTALGSDYSDQGASRCLDWKTGVKWMHRRPEG